MNRLQVEIEIREIEKKAYLVTLHYDNSSTTFGETFKSKKKAIAFAKKFQLLGAIRFEGDFFELKDDFELRPVIWDQEGTYYVTFYGPGFAVTQNSFTNLEEAFQFAKHYEMLPIRVTSYL